MSSYRSFLAAVALAWSVVCVAAAAPPHSAPSATNSECWLIDREFATRNVLGLTQAESEGKIGVKVCLSPKRATWAGNGLDDPIYDARELSHDEFFNYAHVDATEVGFKAGPITRTVVMRPDGAVWQVPEWCTLFGQAKKLVVECKGVFFHTRSVRP